VDNDYHGVGVEVGGQVDIFSRKGYGDVRPLGLCEWTFDNQMVYFSIVISALSLALKVCVGTPGNCEDYAMGWESFALVLGFQDLRRMWRWQVVFGLDLGLLFCVGSVICGIVEGYVICGAGGDVICGTCRDCGCFVLV
jgi:hypothetical protein